MQRVWREEGLRVPQARRRKRPVGDGPDAREVSATAPDEVWALDFQADQTADGRPIRLVNIIDEHTRQALVMHAARSISADEVVSQLGALVARSTSPLTYVAVPEARPAAVCGPELHATPRVPVHPGGFRRYSRRVGNRFAVASLVHGVVRVAGAGMSVRGTTARG